MNMKLSEVLSLNDVLQKIIDGNENNSTIDISLKFRLLTIAKSLEPHIDNFQVIMNQKINEYGKVNEENGTVGISADDKEAIQKFNEDMEKLVDTEVSVNIQKLKAGDVFNKLSYDQLVSLYSIIEE